MGHPLGMQCRLISDSHFPVRHFCHFLCPPFLPPSPQPSPPHTPCEAHIWMHIGCTHKCMKTWLVALLLKDSAASLHVWTTKWDSDTGILEANFILAKSSLAIVSTGEDSCVHPRRFLPAFPAAHHLLIHLVRFILQLLIHLICSILLICLVYPVLLIPHLGWDLPRSPRWLTTSTYLMKRSGDRRIELPRTNMEPKKGQENFTP